MNTSGKTHKKTSCVLLLEPPRSGHLDISLTIIKCFRVKPHISGSTTKNALIFFACLP